MTLAQFFEKGGPLMWPLLALSVASLGIFLERLWVTRRVNVIPSGLVEAALRLIEGGKFVEAASICDKHDCAISRIFKVALEKRQHTREFVKETVEEAGRRELTQLQRGAGAIGTISSVAPLVGLLGTVFGMINVFQQVVVDVGGTGQVNAGSLAGGIWEALITTAAGLTIAIPSFLFNQMLLSRTDRYALDMEEAAANVVESLFEAPSKEISA